MKAPQLLDVLKLMGIPSAAVTVVLFVIWWVPKPAGEALALLMPSLMLTALFALMMAYLARDHVLVRGRPRQWFAVSGGALALGGLVATVVIHTTCTLSPVDGHPVLVGFLIDCAYAGPTCGQEVCAWTTLHDCISASAPHTTTAARSFFGWSYFAAAFAYYASTGTMLIGTVLMARLFVPLGPPVEVAAGDAVEPVDAPSDS